MGEKNSAPVIIRKTKSSSHKDHHGSAWKVAYADFVTAMMALFLVLWLVAMLSIQTRQAIGEYFRSYTIFKGTEAGGGKGISMMEGNPVTLAPVPEADSSTIEAKLQAFIEKKLNEFKDQITIITTNEGVRLEIMEMENSPMFELSGATLLPAGKKVLSGITTVLNDLPNNIAIEGHTDNMQYPTEDYTNWELAADRANAVRRELIRSGLNSKKIKKVTSFADVLLLNPKEPDDALNRRVSIMIHTE